MSAATAAAGVRRPDRGRVPSPGRLDGHVGGEQQVQRLDFRVGLRNAEMI